MQCWSGWKKIVGWYHVHHGLYDHVSNELCHILICDCVYVISRLFFFCHLSVLHHSKRHDIIRQCLQSHIALCGITLSLETHYIVSRN